MGYQPYLISNFATGLDRSRKPWIIPDDAFPDILDGYLFRGVLSKREGYSGFANGIESTYCESRMVNRITAEATGQNNAGGVLADISLANTPVRRGTVTVTDGVESHIDDGEGGFLTAAAGAINYTTGVISGFQFNAASGAAVTVTYDYHQGLPVLGLMSFYRADNSRELIVADTTSVNRYNAMTDVLDDITVTPFTSGDNTNFWSWLNYPDKDDVNRLLFVNNKVQIQRYYTSASPLIDPYPVYTTADVVSSAAFDTGTGITGPYAGVVLSTPVVPRTVVLVDVTGTQTVRDNGEGVLTGQGSGTVDYDTGVVAVTFTTAVGAGNAITVSYTHVSSLMETALKIFQFQDRLIILRPTYSGGIVHPRRIQISGTGIFTDYFVGQAPGAGFIDIPADGWIQGAAFNRDDLLIFMENSVWALKYTNNDSVPFVLDKKDGSKGARAPFSVRTYLNRTMAAGKNGLLLSDGYQVDRMDQKIPDFVLNEVDNSVFKLCYTHAIERDNDMFMLYPEPGQTVGSEVNTRILYTSFDEDNFAVFRLPLSVIGEFQTSFTIVWTDLTAENGIPNWDTFGAKYNNWRGFAFGGDVNIPVGGGESGQVWKIALSGQEDNPQQIRSLSVATGEPVDTVTVETDFNTYVVGDMINIEDPGGMSGIDSTQSRVIAITVANRTFTLEYPQDQVTGTFTSGGVAKRVIPFEVTSKQFNPYIKEDKKLQLGYTYFYVDTDVSDLEDPDTGNSVNTTIEIGVKLNDTQTTARPKKYEVNCTNLTGETDVRRWYKMWVNNTGRFVQLNMKNEQSGATVNIHALMLGLKPTGRVI